ncbi:uncharacterized protein LOC135610030 [Musa acuminata AAA Group]|uniref:uncharacterized protein LOC135610030 n=1 Tax=Musa acuminata AAA Group TaxID=214697 RepID=UPI0031D06D3C
MGCVSSKLLVREDDEEANHVVFLTSTTYGVLNLDRNEAGGKREDDEEEGREVIKREWRSDAKEEPAEVIDAWELMEGLADETPVSSPLKRSPKPHPSTHASIVSPSPKSWKTRRESGKENTEPRRDSARWDLDPNRILRPFSSSDNARRAGLASSLTPRKKLGRDSGGGSVSRRSLGPVFDPDLLASLEREHVEEGEQMKKMVTLARDSSVLLQYYEEKCPPGGQNSVVIYTTTLRGIRKTFEDCNAVRSTLESHRVRVMERDISMDSGYRAELRTLMGGAREVKVPAVFVKGRLLGGAAELAKLEEDGALGPLLQGIPRAATACEGCGGVSFVVCVDCSGSCRVLDEEEKKMVKCGKCNENGLRHCPMCC